MPGVTYGFGFQQSAQQQIQRTQTDPSQTIATPLGSRQVMGPLAAGVYTQSIHPSAQVCALVPPTGSTQPWSFGGLALAEGAGALCFAPSPLSPPPSFQFTLGGTGWASGGLFQQD
jgi:hypothetical protein